MRFHLNYIPPASSFKINHNSKVFLIGSCFSDHIGNYLSSRRFTTLSNPSGNLFNPFSIETYLTNCLNQTLPNTTHFIQNESTVLSYLHHSSINAISFSELENKIKTIQKNSFEFLKTCDYLFITFGTAFYYHHKSFNLIVSNCHKQASLHFEKLLAKQNDIVEIYKKLILQLKKINPKIKIIFTVSPVKHLKDGIAENSLSKSTLLLAIHELVSSQKDCFYFPAFELVNDDLRDYRFYKEDLAHPNELAIKYVWDKFSEVYFETPTQELNHKIEQLQLALNHNNNSASNIESVKFDKHIQKLELEINSKLKS